MTKSEILRIFRDDWTTPVWTFCATLKFRDSPHPLAANEIFKKWINEIDQDEELTKFYWVQFAPEVLFEDDIRFYVLIKGVRSSCKHRVTVRWQQLAGDALLEYSARCGGALRYLKANLPSGVGIGMSYLGCEFEA